MNWYDILKVQTQSQRQGFRLDDKDEDYVLEDEDETCYEKLVKLLTQQEGFNKGIETTDFIILSREIEDVRISIFLKKGHKEEIYCWLVEKESLYPGKMASGFKSALNRAMGLTNPNIDRIRTFKIGDNTIEGGSVFYPKGELYFGRPEFIESYSDKTPGSERQIMSILAYKKET